MSTVMYMQNQGAPLKTEEDVRNFHQQIAIRQILLMASGAGLYSYSHQSSYGQHMNRVFITNHQGSVSYTISQKDPNEKVDKIAIHVLLNSETSEKKIDIAVIEKILSTASGVVLYSYCSPTNDVFITTDPASPTFYIERSAQINNSTETSLAKSKSKTSENKTDTSANTNEEAPVREVVLGCLGIVSIALGMITFIGIMFVIFDLSIEKLIGRTTVILLSVGGGGLLLTGGLSAGIGATMML